MPPSDYHIPESITFPYNAWQLLQSQTSPVASGASTTLVNQNLSLDGCPEALYIWVGPQNSDKALTIPDFMLAIQSLSITFQGVSGILSNATPMLLWQLSRKNGVELSWPQFSGTAMSSTATQIPTCGSLIALKVGSDLPLPPGFVPGQSGSFSLVVQCNAKNQTASTVNAVMNVAVGYPGSAYFGATGQIQLQSAPVSDRDALKASEDTLSVPYSALQPTGGFDFGAILKRGWRNLMPFLHNARKAAAAADSAARVADQIMSGSALSGAGVARRVETDLQGGRVMSRGKLARALRR
jgi:hypothetical protein